MIVVLIVLRFERDEAAQYVRESQKMLEEQKA